jgi:hypothetical protein
MGVMVSMEEFFFWNEASTWITIYPVSEALGRRVFLKIPEYAFACPML